PRRGNVRRPGDGGAAGGPGRARELPRPDAAGGADEAHHRGAVPGRGSGRGRGARQWLLSTIVISVPGDGVAPGRRIRRSPVTSTSGTAVRRLDLSVQGMTCAVCANRVERKLNKVD